MSLYTCPDYAAIESQQDARRYSEMLDAAERRSRAEFEMAADFLRACRRGDANALATWAPKCTDYTGQPYLIGGKQVRPQRERTLSEVMEESLDYTGGPDSVELHQLLLNAAAGTPVKELAENLLKRMADKFAEMNVEAA